MSKVGRPAKNGMQPAWKFRRDTLIFCEFDEARRVGQKYEAAIDQVVAALKRKYPLLPVSKTEVKRVLAKYRAHNSAEALVVSKPIPMTREDMKQIRKIYTDAHWELPSWDVDRPWTKQIMTIEPTPRHPRFNAVGDSGK